MMFGRHLPVVFFHLAPPPPPHHPPHRHSHQSPYIWCWLGFITNDASDFPNFLVYHLPLTALIFFSFDLQKSLNSRESTRKQRIHNLLLQECSWLIFYRKMQSFLLTGKGISNVFGTTLLKNVIVL